MKEFSLVYHFANKENRCICCDGCEGDDCNSDPKDPFERGPCSEDCFKEYQDFKDRGYELLGIENKDWEGLTFKQFVNLEVKTSWAETKDIIPWQNAYDNEVHDEDLYDSKSTEEENFKNRSRATDKATKDKDKQSYPLKEKGDKGKAYSVDAIDFFGTDYPQERIRSDSDLSKWQLENPPSGHIDEDEEDFSFRGGLGKFKVFFEKLFINSTEDPDEECQIYVKTNADYNNFVSSEPTTYLAKGGEVETEENLEFITPKGEPIASINGNIITSYVPIQVNAKSTNFFIRGRKMIREYSGEPSSSDKVNLKECYSTGKANESIMYENESNCNYITGKIFKSEDEDNINLIKIENYINL